MKPFIGVFGLFLLVLPYASSVSYYLSNSGSDSNDGKFETTPWKTITKLNSVISTGMSDGDVIKLQRGDTFLGGIKVLNGGTVSTIK